MHVLKPIFVSIAALVTLATCSGQEISAEIRRLDVPTLRTMIDQSLLSLNAQIPDAVLAQVSVDPSTGTVIIRIVNRDSTIGADIVAPSPDTPLGEWQVLIGKYTPLSGSPHIGIKMEDVRIGPTDVIRATFNQWPQCKPRSINLVENDGQAQWWFVFCDSKEGILSGRMNAATGEFFPSGNPPALAPPTAKPES